MGSISSPQTIVLISGANQGLGFETVKMLAAEQSNFTILLGSRDLAKGSKAAESVTTLASGTVVEPIQLEITSDESISKAVDEVSAKYGRLDVLFNNAAIVGTDQSREAFRKVLDTNVTSAYLLTEAFIPLLKKAALPRAVFMSSGLASLALTLEPSWAFYGVVTGSYTVSKTAMNMVALQIAVKYRDDGLKVNIIDPGFNATNLNGYAANARKNISEGALEACRIIVQGKDGQYNTFTDKDGVVAW